MNTGVTEREIESMENHFVDLKIITYGESYSCKNEYWEKI